MTTHEGRNATMTTAKPMRLLFVGAGAVGGFVAARTLEGGQDVTVLAHPARARSLREHGLVVVTPSATTTSRPNVVTADELTADYDAVVLAVKADVLDGAMDDIAAAVTPDTMVVPFLNGMGHIDRLVDRFGSSVIGGVLRVATELQANGSVRLLDPLFAIEIGELDGKPSERTDALGPAFRAAGAAGAGHARAPRRHTQEMEEEGVVFFCPHRCDHRTHAGTDRRDRRRPRR